MHCYKRKNLVNNFTVSACIGLQESEVTLKLCEFALLLTDNFKLSTCMFTNHFVSSVPGLNFNGLQTLPTVQQNDHW